MLVALLLALSVARYAVGAELTSAPRVVRSLNGTGYSLPWQNPSDAACGVARAAASQCFARSETQVLEASGFSFDVPYVNSLEARWEVSVFPVPLDGWKLLLLEMRWNDSVGIDLGSPNRTSYDESVALRIRAPGDLDWDGVRLRIALASTNEDALFLVSCVEMRAGSDWEPPPVPPPKAFHYEYGVAVALIAWILIVAAHRLRARWRVIRHRDSDIELNPLVHTLYLDRFELAPEETGFNDHFVSSAQRCVANGDGAIACKLRNPGERDRFRRLRGARHINLLSFLGLHAPESSVSVFSVWLTYDRRLNEWRRDQYQCAALALRIAQAAACALATLHDHVFVHGDVSCRSMVVAADGCMKLADAGHARDHDVAEYLKLEGAASPLRWMAPEAVKSGVLDLATDRWSLGVLCWEAASEPGAAPFPEIANSDWIAELERLAWDRPDHATDGMWRVANQCLRVNRDDRQGIAALRDELMGESRVLGQHRDDDDETYLLLNRDGRFESQVCVL
jgi:hypothetical protein